MSGFIATGNTGPAGTQTAITNDGFFPDINLAHLRASMRLDGSVSDERLEGAAIAAILSVNTSLASLKTDTGTLADLPAPTINGQSAQTLLYQRAVYAMAAAEMYERYRSYSSTSQGGDTADDLQAGVDELKRDAHFAIRDMLKQVRVTVELI